MVRKKLVFRMIARANTRKCAFSLSFACVLFLALITASLRIGSVQASESMSVPEKIGAGLLLCHEGDVLVLLRNSSHNNNTWGLPGGNADEEDGGDLFVTAQREAIEEMKTLPEFEQVGQVLTKRGKNQQKHYTVFVCSIARNARDSWEPSLNEEHSEWRWVEASELRKQSDLHPVTKMVLKDHWDTVKPLIGAKD